jgi:signal transduction histidine kinase/ligand-binding sensor domain-containing protein/DNA-binding response OmpR family regulator
LSPEGGFSYDGVKSALQDRDGFIWILMENNLYRFDGYQYKQYHTRFTDLIPTEEWTFHNMDIDSCGRFFVSANNGLYIYDKTTDTFNLVWEEEVAIVRTDVRNNVWIRQNAYWHILDIDKKTLTTPLYDGDSLSSISPIFCLNDTDLYQFSNYGKIYHFNDAKKEFSFCMRLPDENRRVLYVKAHQGKLWALVQKCGLYKVNPATSAIEAHFDFPKELENISASSLRAFYIDKKGYVWLGTINGLYILNPETKEYRHYVHDESNPYSLPSNSVWAINEDRQKNIWIGMYSGKLCYVNPDEKIPFATYYPQEKKLNHRPVSAFAEDKQSLWIGTEGGGINRMDKQSGQFTYYTRSENENSLASNNIKSLLVDKEQNVWIAMYTGGLDCYNPKTKQFKHFRHDAKNGNSLLFDDIRKIILECDSGLWITYQSKKLTLSFYSFRNKKFTHYDFANGEKDYYLFDMVRGQGNQLWLLSSKNLYRMDIQKHSIEEAAEKDSLFMDFFTSCLDDSGFLWIGTIGNGLVKYNPATSGFTFYKDVLKYNISSIYSICNDNEGNIWMGTDNGLICYDIGKNAFSRYDTQDGVQGNVYYPFASAKGADGNLYFGGATGFTIVNPGEIMQNIYKPKIILSDFLIDNVSSKFENEIVLNHNQTNFGFRFASDNYLIAEKNHFKYRLKGYDDRWIEVDASNRTALYSKVPPGDYTFEILASNNDGVWSDTPTVVNIHRKPAPWFSLPAYIAYCLMVLGLLYLIFRYFHDKRKLKMQLYLENVEKNKNEEIHQAQLRFYTDISHDFKTPLSLILAALYKSGQEGMTDDYYNILNSNSRRLLNLVNELMDFKTVENGKMKLQLQAVDVNTFIEGIASDFKEYAQQRKIDFLINTDSPLSTVYIDKNVVEKIIMNLLNNAFKYTKEGGVVSIEVHLGDDFFQSPYTANYVIKGETVSASAFSIIIKDTGVGIPQELMESIFERYYKVNTINFDPHLGTGIGLALVKSLVLLHKGKLSIFSEKDRGTDIELRFSTDKTGYNTDDFIQEHAKDFVLNNLEETPNILLSKTMDMDKLPENYDINKILKTEKRRILLVEDNDDLRKLIAETLVKDYEIIQAENGMIASELLSEREIDLVLSDIMMPEKDGITLCLETKSNIELSHIPFVLLTAKTGLESKIESAGSGADIYLEKPIDLNLLKLTLRNIFKRQQQLREYYGKNYFADSADLSSNERDNKFLKDFIKIIEDNLSQPKLDVNYIASEMSMSRSKLYNKIKMMTGKSIVEFVLNQRMRKAARLIIESDRSMREVMEEIGIESQAYFTNAFKKEFGETPSAFAAKHKPS